MVIDDSANDLPLRQSAVVNLKTHIDKFWKNNMTEQDKSVIKGTIVDALIRCCSETKLRKQYEDIIYKIVTLDYP